MENDEAVSRSKANTACGRVQEGEDALSPVRAFPSKDLDAVVVSSPGAGLQRPGSASNRPEAPRTAQSTPSSTKTCVKSSIMVSDNEESAGPSKAAEVNSPPRQTVKAADGQEDEDCA